MGLRSRIPLYPMVAAWIIGGCTTSPDDRLKWTFGEDHGQIALGETLDFTIEVASKQDINSDLELTSSGAAGIVTTLPPTVTSTVSTIHGSFYAEPSAEPGAYPIGINVREKGAGYGLEKTFLLTVTEGGTAPDFSLEVDPIESALAFETGKTMAFYVRPLNDFTGAVSLSLSGVTDDVQLLSDLTPPSLEFDGTTGGAGGTFVIAYHPMPPVVSPVVLTLTATSGSISHSRTMTLTLPN